MGSKTLQVSGALAGLTMIVGGTQMAVATTISGDISLANSSINLGSSVDSELDESSDSASSELSFNYFDASLGTLTGATFTLSDLEGTPRAGISGSPEPEASEVSSWEASNDYVFQLSFDTLGLSKLVDISGPVSLDCDDIICESAEEYPSVSSSYVFSDGDLLSFVGVGAFDMTAFTSSILTVGSFNNEYDFESLIAYTNFYGLLSLEYDYDERVVADVPEPSTLALFGTALAVFGVAAARRRKRQA